MNTTSELYMRAVHAAFRLWVAASKNQGMCIASYWQESLSEEEDLKLQTLCRCITH
jgi:hypothetical protein